MGIQTLLESTQHLLPFFRPKKDKHICSFLKEHFKRGYQLLIVAASLNIKLSNAEHQLILAEGWGLKKHRKRLLLLA